MQPLQPPKKPRSIGKIVLYTLLIIALFSIPALLNNNSKENIDATDTAVEDSTEETVPADAIVNEPVEETEEVVEEKAPEEPVVDTALEDEFSNFYETQFRSYQQSYDSLWAEWKQVPTDIYAGVITPDQGLQKLSSIADEYQRMASELNALQLPESFPSDDRTDMSLAFSNFSKAMTARANASLMMSSQIAMIVASNGSHQVDMSQVESFSDDADEALLEATYTIVEVSQKYGFEM